MKLSCPITALGGNEAKSLNMGSVKIVSGLLKRLSSIKEEMRLRGFMGSIDKNCSRKESVKRLLVGPRESGIRLERRKYKNI